MISTLDYFSFGISVIAICISIFNLFYSLYINKIDIQIEVLNYKILDANEVSMTFEANTLFVNRSRTPITITKFDLLLPHLSVKPKPEQIPDSLYELGAEIFTFVYTVPIDNQPNFNNPLKFSFNASRGKCRVLSLKKNATLRLNRYRTKEVNGKTK